MTTKTKMSNLESYRELSIQITTLEMKVDKILELLNKPEVDIQPLKLDPFNCDKVTPHCISGGYCECIEKFKESMKEATTVTLTEQEWRELYK